MSNVVVSPSYLNIAHMPDNLRREALEKLKDIPSEAYWPKVVTMLRSLNIRQV